MRREDLEKYKTTMGLALGHLEKDYLQHIILSALARRAGPALTFKGGTLLQKVWALPRFSEDLDFTQNGDFNLNTTLQDILRHLKNHGHSAELKLLKELPISIAYRFSIKGPLFMGADRSLCHVRVEISLREQVVISPIVKEITPLYSTLTSYLVSVMSQEEILAEKVRAIYMRKKGRDIFDLSYLLKRGIEPNLELINKKLAYNNTQFQMSIFTEHLDEVGKDWKRDLTGITTQLPDRKKTIELIISHFKNLA